ncbi:MAG: helix-turn-helix domain-containing protein [Planctomycetes bacterium]|nr:helix-turn-helix domain-containing protein [Planctomycetota bacterium]
MNRSQSKNPNSIGRIGARIGKAIRKLRLEQGLTQDEFCKKNSLKTPTTLSAIEKGRVIPTTNTIINICKNSNISSDALLFGSAIKALGDDVEKLNKIKRALKNVLFSHGSLLMQEEMKQQTEITKVMEKRDKLLESLEAHKSGRLKLKPDQLEIIEHDLKFERDRLEFLQRLLDTAKNDAMKYKETEKVLRELLSDLG